MKRERVQAIVAHGFGRGVVLHATPGSSLKDAADMEEGSCAALDISDVPEASSLSLWEGWFCYENGAAPGGDWRALTDEEWTAVREGRNPLAPLGEETASLVGEPQREGLVDAAYSDAVDGFHALMGEMLERGSVAPVAVESAEAPSADQYEVGLRAGVALAIEHAMFNTYHGEIDWSDVRDELERAVVERRSKP